jgi:hypothetical protein
MTPSGVSRWLRNQGEAIEAAEGIRIVCRAVDETGSMSNVVAMDLVPPYDFRELSRDLVERCSDGAPDAEKVRIHLHLVNEDGRQEFGSKVFRCVGTNPERWASPTDAATARLLGQYVAMSQLLIEAAQSQYETSIRSQETQIALVHEVGRLIVQNAESEAALAFGDERRTIGDRVADVAELAVAHHLGVPVSQIAGGPNGGPTPPANGTTPDPEPPSDGPPPPPTDLDHARKWVQSLSPEELKTAIMNDPVIAPAVARAWTGKG